MHTGTNIHFNLKCRRAPGNKSNINLADVSKDNPFLGRYEKVQQFYLLFSIFEIRVHHPKTIKQTWSLYQLTDMKTNIPEMYAV